MACFSGTLKILLIHISLPFTRILHYQTERDLKVHLFFGIYISIETFNSKQKQR